jgi:hypothetical protein
LENPNSAPITGKTRPPLALTAISTSVEPFQHAWCRPRSTATCESQASCSTVS